MPSQFSDHVSPSDTKEPASLFTTADNIDLSTAFYDVMFGKPDENADSLNEIEREVCKEIEILLEHKGQLASLVPPLPTQLLEITNALSNEATDFDQIGHIIHKDVALAGEVIKMANSPLFRRSSTPIESLEVAIPRLGLVGITNIATTVLTERIINIKPIYFKTFGKHIWTHSLECAIACRNLAGKHDPSICYFLGLIHDVGKVVMFKCLVDCFSRANPDSVPGGKLFKQMMIDYSLWLSWRIAEEWGVADSIITALKQQRFEHQEDLGAVLYQGNLCSEVHMLIKANYLTFEDGKMALQDAGLDEESIFLIYKEMESTN